MKLGILGDLHKRFTPPIHRTDNYYVTQFEKLKQAFDHFVKHGCTAVLQPGDFFNSYGRDPLYLIYDVISFLKKYSLPVYLVFGQHDLKFHNLGVTDIPLRILENAELVHVLGADPTPIGSNVFLYGASWNEKIPQPEYIGSKIRNILCMHKMVIKSKPLWPGQTDYTKARSLLKYEHDLFVCGDNHEAFTYKNRVVNCGSLCRMRVDQAEHKPMCAVYDTKTRELKTHELKIKENVLRKEEFEKGKDDKRRTDAFAKSLRSDFEGELNYRSNIQQVMRKKRRIKPRTKEIVEEALNEQG